MFGKIFTLLGIVAVAKTSASGLNITDEIAQIKEFVNEVASTGVEAHAQAKANKKAYNKALERIIEQAELEIEQNWATVLQPVAQDFSDFVETL